MFVFLPCKFSKTLVLEPVTSNTARAHHTATLNQCGTVQRGDLHSNWQHEHCACLSDGDTVGQRHGADHGRRELQPGLSQCGAVLAVGIVLAGCTAPSSPSQEKYQVHAAPGRQAEGQGQRLVTWPREMRVRDWVCCVKRQMCPCGPWRRSGHASAA